MSKLRRAVAYSAVGFATEVVFSAIHDAVRGRKIGFRTHPWMLPIYALVAPLYEPVHARLRGSSLPLRGVTYGVGFLAVEYVSGSILRRTRGEAPWDYSEARLNVNGLIRIDYLAYWAAAGLALEPLHDRLTA